MNKYLIFLFVIYSGLSTAFGATVTMTGQGQTMRNYRCNIDIALQLDNTGAVIKNGSYITYRTNLYGASYLSADRPNDSIEEFTSEPLSLKAHAYESGWSRDGFLGLPYHYFTNGSLAMYQNAEDDLVINASWDHDGSGSDKFNDTCLIKAGDYKIISN